MLSTLDSFVNECRTQLARGGSSADFVDRTAPLMKTLIDGNKDFLNPQHYQADPQHYARNAIFIDPQNQLSLYALIWLPGQWTPIHDHGTWGVVGVVEGTLVERSYMRVDHNSEVALDDIELARGGVIMLSPGAISSFVPNPDHIHITGNADAHERIVSLHLYGHGMQGFHIYNAETHSRKWVDVSHNES